MEVVEHVIDLFISKTAKLLKNDGIMFIATINKTLKSYVMAIVGAEYILRYCQLELMIGINLLSLINL